MLASGPDSDEVLEVMGTDAFENFVRELEKEGVHVQTERTKPKPPITVAPIRERSDFDVEIPRTEPFLIRSYTKLGELDVDGLASLFELSGLDGGDAIRLTAEAAAHGYDLGKVVRSMTPVFRLRKRYSPRSFSARKPRQALRSSSRRLRHWCSATCGNVSLADPWIWKRRTYAATSEGRT